MANQSPNTANVGRAATARRRRRYGRPRRRRIAGVIFTSRWRGPVVCTPRRFPSKSAGVLNDTEARALHLGLGLFLAFLCFRCSSRSAARFRSTTGSRDRRRFRRRVLPPLLQRARDAARHPLLQDIIIASVGIVLLLEATRRAVGLPMTILALLFLAYIMLGRYLPDVLAHKGASLERMLSHQWLTHRGRRARARRLGRLHLRLRAVRRAARPRRRRHYMMQVLRHARPPARRPAGRGGVLGAERLICSSVSNVVSGGIFTIPLMAKAGYGGVKAGAIETASSVNGQIMPR